MYMYILQLVLCGFKLNPMWYTSVSIVCLLLCSSFSKGWQSSMDTVQRLEYHIILMIGEGDDILKNARNLFKHKDPTYSSLMQWRNKTQAFTLLDGEWQIVNECTMLHIVGHGDSTYAAARDKEETKRHTSLGGLSATELAFVVQLLLTFNEELSSTCSASIGHVTLVSCQIHDHSQAAGHDAEEEDSQGKGSFITLFLYQLVSQYGIYTSVSGWSRAIAVDDDGRILSRVKSSGLRNDYQWYINYPGSLVFANIISAANYDYRNSSRSLHC